MFNNTIFSAILKPLPRDKFQSLVTKHGTDRYKKSYKSWDHLVTMLCVQLSSANSLRDLEMLMNENNRTFYHLNLTCKAVKRSTISYTNNYINPDIFRDFMTHLMKTNKNKNSRKQLAPLLTILDSSLIMVRGRGSQWAETYRNYKVNQGLKLHLLLDAENGEIDYVDLSNSNVTDLSAALKMPLESGRLYVFDKGYCKYNWWKDIIDAGSYFATRLKSQAAYEVLSTNPIDNNHKDFIINDRVIAFRNKQSKHGDANRLAGVKLRLVQITHPKDKNRKYEILTNDLQASAVEIANWYKRRWDIELLFKWLKQNFKIKKLLGESRNAIMVQVYIAIISYILLQTYKRSCNATYYSMKDLLFSVKNKLFLRAKLIERMFEQRRNETNHPLLNTLSQVGFT